MKEVRKEDASRKASSFRHMGGKGENLITCLAYRGGDRLCIL